MSTQFSWSCELMTNFRQAEVVAADSLFQALQTDAGDSLLFSVDAQGALGVVTESPGTATGWVRHDLSTGLRGTGGRVKTFAAGQNYRTGGITVLAVVTVAGRDEVHVSLDNSASDLAWLQAPVWRPLPYDDPRRPRTEIVEAFVSDATDAEYLVVDVRRDPGTGVGFVHRYFLDPAYDDPDLRLTGRAWNPNDVAVDLSVPPRGTPVATPGTTSCLGRRRGDTAEGIYSLGSVAGSSVLAYQQLYDLDRLDRGLSGAPAVTLRPPASTTGLTAVRMKGDATDLYVVAGRTLYRYPADAQRNPRAEPAALHSDPLFDGVTALYGFADPTRVVLWGRSRSGQLFSTACPLPSLHDPSAWSRPLPLLSGVDQISPYLNRRDGGNTFFAASGARLTKLHQDPFTGIWNTQKILLPTPATAPAVPFTSYTTRVNVTVDGEPAPGATLSLSASHRAGVTVDQAYVVVDPTPVEVTADPSGTVTIIEPAQGLRGTTLTLRAEDGATVTINPMDGPMRRAGEGLGSEKKLGQGPVIVDDRGATRPLLAPGTSAADRSALASAVSGLVSAYADTPSGATAVAATVTSPSRPDPGTGPGLATLASVGVGASVPTAAPPVSARGFADAVVVAGGDLLQAVTTAVDYVAHIVWDAVGRSWNFVCEIAGRTMRFVIDAADKAVAALVAVVEAVVKTIKDVVDFLKYVFGWDDIVRTKDVLKNLTLLTARHGVAQLATAKQDMRATVDGLVAAIEKWADLRPDRFRAVDAAAPGGAPPGTGTALSRPENFLAHQITGNVDRAVPVVSAVGDRATSALSLGKRLLEALEAGGRVFADAADAVRDVMTDAAGAPQPPPIGEIATKLMAVVARAATRTADVFLGVLIDILVAIADAVLDALGEPIWIPVVSDALEYFGITITLSMLDVICFAAAIPATATYKATMKKAPFSADDGFSGRIIDATDLTELGAPAADRSPARGLEVPA